MFRTNLAKTDPEQEQKKADSKKPGPKHLMSRIERHRNYKRSSIKSTFTALEVTWAPGEFGNEKFATTTSLFNIEPTQQSQFKVGIFEQTVAPAKSDSSEGTPKRISSSETSEQQPSAQNKMSLKFINN